MLGWDRRRGGTPPAKKRTNREQSKNIAGTVPVPNPNPKPNPKPNQFSGRWLGTAGHRSATQAAERVASMALGLVGKGLGWSRQQSSGGRGYLARPGLGDREQNGNKTRTKGEQKGSLGRFLFLADFCGFGAGGPLRWPSWHNPRTTTPLI